MSKIIEIIVIILLLPAVVQTSWLAVVLCGNLFRRRNSKQSTAHRFNILIPAHNERKSIGKTLQALQSVDYPAEKFQVTVIADNCEDNTAEIARGFGVWVIDRSSDKRSKGFALEECIPIVMKNEEWDALIILDADSYLEPNALRFFSGALSEGKQRIQGYYGGANPEISWRTELMEWAFSIFNGIYLSGLNGLGVSSHLRGNGMCAFLVMPTRCSMEGNGLAEDLEYSWKLRSEGLHVDYLAEAVVREFVSSSNASVSQRRRWEQGRKDVHQRAWSILGGDNNFLLNIKYALDISLWPLGRLTAYLLFASFISFIFGGEISQILAVFSSLTLIIYVLSPYFRGLIPIRYLLRLLWVPYYIAWKAFVSLKRRPAAWVRTARESERSPAEESSFAFGGVNFDAMNLRKAAEAVIQLGSKNDVALVVTPNTDHLVRFQTEPLFRSIVSTADLVLADGYPIVWASKLSGGAVKERVTGADLLPETIELAARENIAVALIGGNPGEAKLAAERFKREHPGLAITSYCPPIGFENNDLELGRIKSMVEMSNAKIIFVGVGSPKQEVWIDRHRDVLPPGAYLGVGMAIGFASGRQKRAPIWIQKIGMEWLYRLSQEPKRLGLRYIKCLKIIPMILKHTFRAYK